MKVITNHSKKGKACGWPVRYYNLCHFFGSHCLFVKERKIRKTRMQKLFNIVTHSRTSRCRHTYYCAQNILTHVQSNKQLLFIYYKQIIPTTHMTKNTIKCLYKDFFQNEWDDCKKYLENAKMHGLFLSNLSCSTAGLKVSPKVLHSSRFLAITQL